MIGVYTNRVRRTETADNGGEVERDIPFLKAHTVFNLEQIDDLPDEYLPSLAENPRLDVNRIAAADGFFAATGAMIRHGGNKAFFAPGLDIIQMPPIETFRDVESYYAILSHGHIHWVGAKHRLDRDLSRYGKDKTERARSADCLARRRLPVRRSRHRAGDGTATGSRELYRILALGSQT